MTSYHWCMTMLSFRVEDSAAARAEEWATRLGIDRSELLREALRQHLDRLGADQDPDRYDAEPLSEDELSLARIADWGPAEDWADWADAAR
jgi:antitoxin MazE2